MKPHNIPFVVVPAAVGSLLAAMKLAPETTAAALSPLTRLLVSDKRLKENVGKASFLKGFREAQLKERRKRH